MADVTIGAKLTLDAGQSTKTMKEFKQEIKSANEDLLNMQRTFGATSKEALAAAKRVAELKDNIQDANETAKLFDPGNRFQVLGNAVRGLVGGFTALQGALALVGVEGEEVQKTLLKVQGALALTEGLNTVADVTKDFQRLGSVLVQTLGKSGLIGVAIAGVTALGLAFAGVFDGAKKLTTQQQALLDVNKEAAKVYAQERLALESLVEPLKSESASRQDKINAIKKLQDTYPNYFKNLDLEGDKVVGLAQGYNLLVKAIGLKARATAAGNLLAKQEEELLGLGFQVGITTEEEAVAFLKKLEGTDNLVNNLILSKAKDAIDRRKFLQETILDSEKQLKLLGGDPTGKGGGVSTSSRVAVAKAENKAIELQYSTHEDNLLLIQEEKKQKFIENRQKFIEEGMRLEQAEFDEKFALLNLELDIEEAAAKKKVELAEWERNARVTAANDIGIALGALSDLIGKETAAGKALAIAQAVINTWLGVTEVLKQKSVLPEPFATISRIASITTVIASGLNAVKNIGKAKVPGSGSGSSASIGGGSVAAPLQPRAPGATNTLLDQQQLNQIGNATVRAFVIETDVSSNQERIRRLNRAARI